MTKGSSATAAPVASGMAYAAAALGRPGALRGIALLAVLSISAGVSALIPLTTARIVDEIVNSASAAALRNAALLALLTIGSALTGAVAYYLGANLTQKLQRDLSALLFDRVQDSAFSFIRSTATGATVNRLRDDIAIVATSLQGVVFPACLALLTVILSLSGMLYLDRELSGVLVVMLATWVVFALLSGRKVAALQSSLMSADDNHNSFLFERLSIGGFLRTKCFVGEIYNRAALTEILERKWQTSKNIAVVSGSANAIGAIVMGLGPVVALYIGIGRVASHELTIGALTAFIAFNARLMQPLAVLVNLRLQASSLSVAFQRVAQLLDATPEPAGLDCPEDLTYELRAVSYRYDDVHVLRGVSLEIPYGASVLLTGPNGSGKSSLASIMTKLSSDYGGEVRLGGFDLRAIDGRRLRRVIRYISADTPMFDCSIRENLLFGSTRTHSDRELWELLEFVMLADVVRNMPHGLDALPGTSGTMLSAGERQVLLLATVIIEPPRMCILDEATSALSADRECDLIARLRERMAGGTLILVSHRDQRRLEFDIQVHMLGGSLSAVREKAVETIA